MDHIKNISPEAIICGDCIIQGNVAIGAKTIIHPKVTIIAEDGPIVIGENNIIEELTTIINKNGKLEILDKTLHIGSNNVIQVGSYVAASSIGDNNVFEHKSHVDIGVEVKNHCLVGAMCSVGVPLVLEDHSVVYGRPAKIRIHNSQIQPQARQIDLLTKLLPKYHMTLQQPSTT